RVLVGQVAVHERSRRTRASRLDIRPRVLERVKLTQQIRQRCVTSACKARLSYAGCDRAMGRSQMLEITRRSTIGQRVGVVRSQVPVMQAGQPPSDEPSVVVRRLKPLVARVLKKYPERSRPRLGPLAVDGQRRQSDRRQNLFLNAFFEAECAVL